MSDRKEGWYWVKPNKSTDKWRPDYYKDGKWRAIWSIPEEDPIHFEIGDRIPTPDEMEGWQVVPKEPDSNMQLKGGCAVRIDTTDINRLWTANSAYKAMLQAAPKPGDVWQPN